MNTEWLKLVESYTMHLELGYSKRTDWCLHIWKKGCAKDGKDLEIFFDQDTDFDLLPAKGEVALKEWLLKNQGGY